MSPANPVADMPLLPRDNDGPVFAAPWQAQAFAVVVDLIDSGKITRTEWADRLGAVLKEAEEGGDNDSGRRYYAYWLKALEGLVVEKDLANSNDLASEKETIRENDHHRRERQLGHEH